MVFHRLVKCVRCGKITGLPVHRRSINSCRSGFSRPHCCNLRCFRKSSQSSLSSSKLARATWISLSSALNTLNLGAELASILPSEATAKYFFIPFFIYSFFYFFPRWNFKILYIIFLPSAFLLCASLFIHRLDEGCTGKTDQQLGTISCFRYD
jgi:hypothetical protein